MSQKYTVKENDTEFSIANSNKVSVGALRKANEKMPQPFIQVGRKIEIPTNK